MAYKRTSKRWDEVNLDCGYPSTAIKPTAADTVKPKRKPDLVPTGAHLEKIMGLNASPKPALTGCQYVSTSKLTRGQSPV